MELLYVGIKFNNNWSLFLMGMQVLDYKRKKQNNATHIDSNAHIMNINAYGGDYSCFQNKCTPKKQNKKGL
jgi:hypothetical protein